MFCKTVSLIGFPKFNIVKNYLVNIKIKELKNDLKFLSGETRKCTRINSGKGDHTERNVISITLFE